MDKKQELKLREQKLIDFVSSFCKQKLNDEYEQLCIKMIRKLCRKRNCPFERGNLAYIIHSGFISGYQNRYGDNLKPPTNVYHRMTA